VVRVRARARARVRARARAGARAIGFVGVRARARARVRGLGLGSANPNPNHQARIVTLLRRSEAVDKADVRGHKHLMYRSIVRNVRQCGSPSCQIGIR
jgi:hypothetical protein